MAVRYVKVTFKDGTAVIAKFERLASLSKYIGRVLGGYGAFPIWRNAGATHPQTGEAVQMRTVSYVPPDEIRVMQEVTFVPDGVSDLGGERTVDSFLDDANNAQWQSASRPNGGEHGTWAVTPELADALALPVGTVLVKHAGPTTTSIVEGEVVEPSVYVIVKQGDGSDATPTTLYDLTRHSLVVNGTITWTDPRASAAALASPTLDEHDDDETGLDTGTGEQ